MMSLVKTILGFLIGAGVGVIVLVAVSLHVPKFQGSNAAGTVAPVTNAVPETTEPVVEQITAPTEPEPVFAPSVPAPVEAPVETADEAPTTAPSILVLQSEKTEADTAENKIKLPTITIKEPVETPDTAIAEPAADTGIKIGKKPKSSLPSITEVPQNTDTANMGKALEFNATDFDATDKPLLGVILLDIGDKGLSVATLKKLNVPITIAILIDAPDASRRALIYHAAGFEVIAMASDDRNNALNSALNSGQINDALDVIFNTVPNAIGLLDSVEAKIQKNSRTSKAVVKNLVDSGHGLITYAKGLNSVDSAAHAAGVRTAKVARTLDANRENKAMMMRYLDRVSLDAGRDGAVIVLGTTAKDTVAALAGWLLSSKGQGVVPAPASAVLLGSR